MTSIAFNIHRDVIHDPHDGVAILHGNQVDGWEQVRSVLCLSFLLSSSRQCAAELSFSLSLSLFLSLARSVSLSLSLSFFLSLSRFRPVSLPRSLPVDQCVPCSSDTLINVSLAAQILS